ncbi:trypsin-like peptidase domain-containing protein [Prosthecobacter sp.]|uniref:trypsin-like peptidase domain-containing protein n=1 Tax=Prosthecobacter sp. TaxID=1965333 RepID=UPI0037848F1A
MNLQINCPNCQSPLSIEQRFMGGQMQCPFCQQIFMVAPPPVVPVVQARQVPSPAQTAPAPGPRSPQNPSRPQSPGSRAPGPRPAASSAAKPPQGGDGMATALIIGLVVLGVGLVFGGFYFLNGVLKKRQMAEKGLGSEINSQLEAKRTAAAKAKQEEEQERTEMMTALRKLLTEHLCEGNEKVAGEIMREVEAISGEADKLFADADVSNDPSDMRAFLAQRMEPRLRSNAVIFNWLGGRVSPKAFCAMLFGQEVEAKPERGKVAEFLVAGNYAATGTGFYVSRDGWLLTNEHVVHDAAEVDVRGADGVIRHAQVVKTDFEGDVAVLRTREPASKWLPLTTQEGTMGAAVFTIGFPNADLQGVEPKFTDGRISSLSGIRDDRDHYQITVPAQPGNSGGPLVDVKSGAVVGIVAAVLRGRENVTYAIKTRVAADLLKTLPAYQTVSPLTRPASTEMEALAAEVRAATVLVLVRK